MHNKCGYVILDVLLNMHSERTPLAHAHRFGELRVHPEVLPLFIRVAKMSDLRQAFCALATLRNKPLQQEWVSAPKPWGESEEPQWRDCARIGNRPTLIWFNDPLYELSFRLPSLELGPFTEALNLHFPPGSIGGVDIGESTHGGRCAMVVEHVAEQIVLCKKCKATKNALPHLRLSWPILFGSGEETPAFA